MGLVVNTPRIAFPGRAGGTGPGTDLIGDSLILKYPGNTASVIENKDVKLSLSATDFVVAQYNGSTYDDVSTTTLPSV